MSRQSPSIQSFFHIGASSTASSPSKKSLTMANSDEIQSSGISSSLALPPENWIPEREYNEVDIESLIPGPQCVTIVGRIANIYDQATPSKMPRAAKGCIRLIVKDDSGAITVRLWYANESPVLRLGHLITLWTSHVSNGENNDLTTPAAPLLVSLFPKRDRSCHFMVQEQSDTGVLCKTPLSYRSGKPLSLLMTLKFYVDGGFEVEGCSVLVCVKSIGPKRTVTNKNNTTSTLITLTVFDNTASAALTLWGSSIASSSVWIPSSTILLLTNPQCKIDRRLDLSIGRNTIVDVDPAIGDAEWLKGFAEQLTVRGHINPPFPEGVFDMEIALTAPVRPLFTLAELDEWVRAAPNETFTGFLSVIILDVHLSTLHMRNMLLCNECCGLPIYGNARNVSCKQCSNSCCLRMNPRALGTLIDETGTLSGSKIILSDHAWTQLLGQDAEDLVEFGLEALKRLERRMKGVRISLLVGWVGRKVIYAREDGQEDKRNAGKGNRGRVEVATSSKNGGMGRLCVLKVMA